MTVRVLKPCILRVPKLFHAVRVNTEKISLAQANGELRKLLNLNTAITHSSVLPYTLITEGSGPNLHISPDSTEVYVDLIGANKILRGEGVPSFCVVGASTSDFRSDQTVAVYVDICNSCRQGRTLNFEGIEKKVFLGNARTKFGRRKMWPTELSLKDGEYKSVFVWTEPVWNIPAFNELSVFGWGSVDTVLETLLTVLLETKSGEKVLFMNPVSGVAAQYSASLMKNQGRIIALSKGTRDGSSLIRRNRKLGFSEIIRVYPSFDSSLNCEPKFAQNCFDRIFLTAPSSELGTRCQFKSKGWSDEQLKYFETVQKRSLKTALELLKPGGRLLYLCHSLRPEEGVEAVSWALSLCPKAFILQKGSFENVEAYETMVKNSFGADSLRVFDPRRFCITHGALEENNAGKGKGKKLCLLKPLSRRSNYPWTVDPISAFKLNCFQDSDGVFVTFLSKRN